MSWIHAQDPIIPLFQHLLELVDNQKWLVEPFSGSIGLSNLHGNGPCYWCLKANYYLPVNSYDLESYHSGINVVQHVKTDGSPYEVSEYM